jgi:signal transduction histidine kinase
MVRTENEDSQPPLPPARILAVDDTQANLIALEAILESLGHELVLARSGAQALELVEREEFAVILLDIQMPGMDGFDTLVRLRRGQGHDAPVLFLTAYPYDEALKRRAYSLGAFDLIPKPIDADALRGKVNALVAFHNRGRELRRYEDALRAKDRYLGVLAHDLRTPLSVVRFAAHLLENDERHHVRKCAERIRRSTARMEGLTRDLLEYARAAESKMPTKMIAMDLAALCRELVDDFAATYPHVQFALELADQALGIWDPDRLHQALANLLSNAVKYGDARVSVRLELEAGWCSVSVCNGGEAISAERLREIYRPFVQGTDGSGGVGLGLYIVREIARAHGGEVLATSGQGRTCFTLRLPALSGAS